jgi:hypothetical protein
MSSRYGSHGHSDDLFSDTREGVVQSVYTRVQESVSGKGDNDVEYWHEGVYLGRERRKCFGDIEFFVSLEKSEKETPRSRSYLKMERVPNSLSTLFLEVLREQRDDFRAYPLHSKVGHGIYIREHRKTAPSANLASPGSVLPES